MAQFFCAAAGYRRSIGRDNVDDTETAAGHQHPKRFPCEQRDIVEVMRSEAADDKIEACVGKGKILGLCRERSDIGQAVGFSKLPGLGEHFFGDVSCRHFGDVGCKGESGMSRAGRYVEHAPMRFGL